MTNAHGDSYYVRDLLRIPSAPGLVEALGELVIAHTQLEYVLRYTIKRISGLSIAEALDGTEQDRASDLRARVKQLFKDKKPTPTEKLQLDALLQRARRLTQQRNDYLHAVYTSTPEGQAQMKGEDHSWVPAPTKDEVRNVTAQLLALSQELNHARLHGFIADVMTRHSQTPPAP